MGSIVLYIMEWAFALIVLLTIYKAVFSGTTLYRFNRFYLLGATLLSALLPLVHITERSHQGQKTGRYCGNERGGIRAYASGRLEPKHNQNKTVPARETPPSHKPHGMAGHA